MERKLTMKKIIWICLIVLFCNNIGFSQAYLPKNKATVIFHANIARDSVSRFLYKYDIENEKSSEGICDEFTLLLVDPLLTSNHTKVLKPTNKKWYIDGSNLGMIYGSPATQFLDIPPENGLAPGESIMISFKSDGLPSITTYYAESFAPPLTTDEFDSLLNAGYTRAQLLPNWKQNSYQNQTIAPNTNFLNLSTSNFLDTLISYKHQCVPLGWLNDNKTCKPDCDNIMNGRDWYNMGDFEQYGKWNPDNSWGFDHDWNNGIVEVLDARLNKAKAELSKKDSVDARRDLEIFVMEVELLNDREQEDGSGNQDSYYDE